ncbi:gliding motility-associated C-terminal domain-containing protein [Marinilabilia salmonicolor]|uniref:gliding motility-associated C-terminal domain-containing protein n=1 Tax=Marinilabilia salmonicolor TaxID=989 RepID=UPI0002E1303B|nr:gliding motility-associated C-terminal domain-containing protein [Marinilabilia salmonicolor]
MEVFDTPEITIPEGDQEVCEDGAVTFSTNVTGTGTYSYQWSVDGTALTGETNATLSLDATTLPGIGLHTVSLEVVDISNPTNCSSTETVQLTVNENPVVSPIADQEVCAGGSVTFTADDLGVGYSYQWSLDGTPLTGENGISLTLSDTELPTAGSTYPVSVVVTNDGTGCDTEVIANLTVNSLPVVNLPDVSTCDGQDATLTATPSGGSGNYVNYTWYDGGGTQIQSSASDQLTLSGTDVELANNGATYSVTVEDDNGCISAADDMTLTVNENPSVEILYNSNPETAIEVCLGSSMTLDAQGSGGTGTYTYTWELPGGNTPTGAQVVVDPIALADGGVYTVTVDDGNCIGTQTIDVTVVEVTATIAVTAPVAGATTICENTSVTFEAGGGDSYEFYFIDASAGTTTMVHDAGNEWTTSTLEDGDQVYVTATNALGCSDDSDPITMTVIDNPTVAIDYPAGEDNEVCAGDDLSVVADPAGYANYDFYIFDGTDHIKVSPDGYTSEAFTYSSDSFNDGDEFYVVASSGAGCSGESAHESVVVHALPNASAANTGPECVGETITLQGGDAGLDTYEWFAPGADLSTDAPIVSGPDADHDLVDIASTDAGIYTLRVTNANGCQATATTDVVVNELPVVSLPADYSVCEGVENHEITANITNGLAPYNVVWEFDDGSGATTILSGEDEITYTIGTVDASNEGTYTVTVTDANGCVSVQENVYLTVDPAPGVAFDASSVTEVCDGSQVTLTAFGNGGVVSGNNTDDYEYVWYHEGTLINGVSTATYQFTGDNGVNDGLYEVVAIDDNGNGCTSPVASMSVTVYELPDATLDVDPAFFIEGTEVTFTAVDGYTSYEFQVNGTTVQGPDVDYVYQDATLQDGDEVTVFVTEDHGAIQCTNSSTVTMTVFDSVEEPVVSVTDEEYCAGAAGATVNVTNPQQDVTYELVYDDGTPVSGYAQIVYDGTNPVSWSNVLDDNGGSSTPTTFRVKAFWAALTPDGDQLSDPFDITENPVPNQFTMSVDGNSAAGGLTETDCNAGTGYTIGLYDGWQSVDYYLILNGTQVLEVKSGSGVVSEFIFDDTYSYVGEYTIVAQNEFGCTTDILGSFIIEGDEVAIFDLNGENNGQYCEGDADGVELTLSGSEAGIEYELFRDGLSLGTFTGDDNSISFGNFTEEGVYRVSVTSAGGCVYLMNNDVTVGMVAAPDAGTLTDVNTNNFHFCEGGEGVDIYQDVVQVENYTYELIGPEGVVSTHTGDNSGTGITYENIIVPGEYFVRVTAAEGIGCSSETDVVEVVEDALPDQSLDVDLFGEKCGTDGIATIGIVSSQSGVQYYWENTTTSEVGTEVQTGNGGELTFNVLDEGVYVFHANIIETGCSVQLDNSVEVIEQPLPDDVDVRLEGGESDCSEPAIIIIDYPQENVEYQLYIEEGGNLIEYHSGGPLHSGGDPIEFDPIIASNTTFVVIATNQITGCESRLSDEIIVNISGAIKPQILDPTSGDICNGEAGIEFRLLDSELGVEYALCLEQGLDVADEIKQTRSGDGGVITFDLESDEGEYYVYAFSGTDGACDIEMANRVELIVNPLPIAYNMVGSGVYCGDEEGAVLGIENSQEGIIYRLQKHTEFGIHLEEEKVGTGDGEPMYFDSVDNIGTTYSVMAISDKGCTSSMKDSVDVSYSPVGPEVPDISETTLSLCGEPFVEVVVNSPEADATYHLYDATNELVSESEVDGGQLVTPLYIFDTEEYTVSASWNGGCMSESVTVNVEAGVEPIVGDVEYTSLVCPTEGASATISYYIGSDIEAGFSFDYYIVDGDEELYEAEFEFSEDGDTITWTIEDAGSYYVAVEGCDTDYSSRIDIEIAPQIPVAPVINDVQQYCEGEVGKDVSIELPDTQDRVILYRLIDADGTAHGAVVSDDADHTFHNIETGVYALTAKEGACSIRIDDFVTVEKYPVPEIFTISVPENTVDLEQESVSISVDNSEEDVLYALYFENEENARTIISGDGDAITFDGQFSNDYGTYSVFAKFEDSPCDWIEMENKVTLLKPSISIIDYRLNDEKCNYCYGEKINFIIEASQGSVFYQLERRLEGGEWNQVGESQPGGGVLFLADQEDYYSSVIDTSLSVSSFVVEYRLIATKNDDPSDFEIMNFVQGDCSSIKIWNHPDNSKEWILTSQDGEPNSGGQCYEDEPLTLTVKDSENNALYVLWRYEEDEIDSQDKMPSFMDSNIGGGVLEFELRSRGYYQIKVSNDGCSESSSLSEPKEIHVYPYEDIDANDYVVRMSENDFSAEIDLLGGINLDPRLDTTDYEFTFDEQSKYFDSRFSFIGEENYQTEGSPFLMYKRPIDFVGIDSVIYTIDQHRCKGDVEPSSGKVTVIVGNEQLPDDLDILIPNAFSPNGDNMNEYFIIRGVSKEDKYIESQQSKLMVFNRWGNLVYESEGEKYDGVDSDWWDGKANVSNMVSIGQDLPNGVYFYIYSITVSTDDGPKKKEYNGFIELRR